MNSASDTIAAIATAPGEAGISIVRISGPQSLDIADRVLTCKAPPPSRRSAGSFVYGFVCEAGRRLDEVIVLIYRAPHSYTREDVIELQGHGGRMSAQRILRVVLNAGARLAEPGEFTRRAFLNGRIDLLQAEAVADLIQSRSDRAAQAAVEQLEGALSITVTKLYDDMIARAADVEATLDFADNELPEATTRGIAEHLEKTISDTAKLLATWEEGHLLREGALVVISGKPNVGKSTLLNLLLGRDRAIVADVPGTTRDTIEEQLILEGVPLRLVDTAGLRETECVVEREGVRRARVSIRNADLNLHMIDSSHPLCIEDRKHVAGADSGKCIIILNKTDIGMMAKGSDFPNYLAIPCCLLKKSGLDEIRRTIIEKLKLYGSDTAHAAISERHRQCVQNALNAMNEARDLLCAGDQENSVLVAQHLREALEALGEIMGRTFTNELLDNVFKRFCTGK